MSDQLLGIVIGFCAAGVFGFAVWKLRLWRKEWQAMGKPQKAEVVSKKGELVSKKTPWQVIVTGLQAGCLIIVVLIAILLGLGVALGIIPLGI